MYKKSIAFAFIFLSFTAFSGEVDVKTTIEAYDDWQVSCLVKAGIKQCQMKQTIQSNIGQLISILSLVKNKQETLLQIALPLMLDLGEKAKVLVDSKQVAALAYKFCNKAACFVYVRNDSKVLNSFKKGNTGSIIITKLNGEKIQLNYSLNGFSMALKNLPVNN